MTSASSTTHETNAGSPAEASWSDRSSPAVPRWPLMLVLAMLLLSTLPDGMVPPVLKGLFVDRYGVSAGAAHWFMAINLIGALLALPLLARLRQRVSPVVLLAGAAAADAVLLGVLMLPMGFGPSLAVRLVEGAADVMVIAVLFDLVGKAGVSSTRGRRFGLAGTVLLLSLACGLLIGGFVGHALPPLVFLCGALGCGLVAVSATAFRRRINGLVHLCPAAEIIGEHTEARATRCAPRRTWPVASMMFGDRMMAGVKTATIPLFLAQISDIQSGSLGILLAIPLAVMALGAWPAGRLGDAVGHPTLRTTAALLYALSYIGLALLEQPSTASVLVIMVMIGLAGAALMPTAFAIGARTGYGSVGMGQMHAAGSVGYFLGIAGAGALLSLLTASSTTHTDYIAVILTFVGAYLALTVLSTIGVRRNEQLLIAMEQSQLPSTGKDAPASAASTAAGATY